MWLIHAVFISNVILLLIPAISANIATEVELSRAGSTCTASGLFCKDCTTRIQCSSSGDDTFSTLDLPCPENQFCGEVSGIGVCFDKGDPLVTEGCTCPDDFQGYIVNPFDSQSYTLCFNGNGSPLSCKGQEFFNIEENKCMTTTSTTTEPPETCDEVGFFAIEKENCKQYKVCVPDGSEKIVVSDIVSCAEDEIFDEATLKCVSESTFLVKEFSCDGKLGLLEDPYDCKAFRICIDGVEIGAPTCCPDAHIFNEEVGACVANEEPYKSDCPQIHECVAHRYDLTCPAETAPVEPSERIYNLYH